MSSGYYGDQYQYNRKTNRTTTKKRGQGRKRRRNPYDYERDPYHYTNYNTLNNYSKTTSEPQPQEGEIETEPVYRGVSEFTHVGTKQWIFLGVIIAIYVCFFLGMSKLFRVGVCAVLVIAEVLSCMQTNNLGWWSFIPSMQDPKGWFGSPSERLNASVCWLALFNAIWHRLQRPLHLQSHSQITFYPLISENRQYFPCFPFPLPYSLLNQNGQRKYKISTTDNISDPNSKPKLQDFLLKKGNETRCQFPSAPLSISKSGDIIHHLLERYYGNLNLLILDSIQWLSTWISGEQVFGSKITIISICVVTALLHVTDSGIKNASITVSYCLCFVYWVFHLLNYFTVNANQQTELSNSETYHYLGACSLVPTVSTLALALMNVGECHQVVACLGISVGLVLYALMRQHTDWDTLSKFQRYFVDIARKTGYIACFITLIVLDKTASRTREVAFWNEFVSTEDALYSALRNPCVDTTKLMMKGGKSFDLLWNIEQGGSLTHDYSEYVYPNIGAPIVTNGNIAQRARVRICGPPPRALGFTYTDDTEKSSIKNYVMSLNRRLDDKQRGWNFTAEREVVSGSGPELVRRIARTMGGKTSGVDAEDFSDHTDDESEQSGQDIDEDNDDNNEDETKKKEQLEDIQVDNKGKEKEDEEQKENEENDQEPDIQKENEEDIKYQQFSHEYHLQPPNIEQPHRSMHDIQNRYIPPNTDPLKYFIQITEVGPIDGYFKMGFLAPVKPEKIYIYDARSKEKYTLGEVYYDDDNWASVKVYMPKNYWLDHVVHGGCRPVLNVSDAEVSKSIQLPVVKIPDFVENPDCTASVDSDTIFAIRTSDNNFSIYWNSPSSIDGTISYRATSWKWEGGNWRLSSSQFCNRCPFSIINVQLDDSWLTYIQFETIKKDTKGDFFIVGKSKPVSLNKILRRQDNLKSPSEFHEEEQESKNNENVTTVFGQDLEKTLLPENVDSAHYNLMPLIQETEWYKSGSEKKKIFDEIISDTEFWKGNGPKNIARNHYRLLYNNLKKKFNDAEVNENVEYVLKVLTVRNFEIAHRVDFSEDTRADAIKKRIAHQDYLRRNADAAMKNAVEGSSINFKRLETDLPLLSDANKSLRNVLRKIGTDQEDTIKGTERFDVCLKLLKKLEKNRDRLLPEELIIKNWRDSTFTNTE